jgi:hypothetical protein
MIISESKFFLSLTVCLLGVNTALSQESVNASGGDATGVGGTVSYSVGQVVYTSNTASTGDVTQGVQHAYEVFSLDVPEAVSNLSLTIFPNPTTSILNLKVGDYNGQKWTYRLYDIQGRQLSSGQIAHEQTEIDVQNLSVDTYFLDVLNTENQQVKSFKIVKK